MEENSYDLALEAIQALFSDKDLSKSDIVRDLNTLKGEIDTLLDALAGDPD